ncbi:MAG: hypothetical protein P1U56_12730 [Saprospiraceae bacterium]|nr:hypothetical protein [Saprospiraceae bacterium]
MSLGTSIANEALKAALPTINRKITKAIQQKGLDPYQHVVHFEESLGKFAGAEAIVSMGLVNLRGLSSLQIESITFTDGDFHPFSDEDSTAAGSFSIKFSQDLTIEADGKLSAKAEIFGKKISHSESIEAELTDSGSTLSGSAEFVIGSLSKLEIKDFHLNELKWHLGENTIHIEGGLGKFDDLLNSVISKITEKVNTELAGQITSALKLAIQKSVDAVLPMALNG